MVVLAFANEQEGRGYLHELPREARELCGPASHLSFLLRVGPTHRRIPKLCQTSSGIVPRMRIPRTRFCRAPSLITICEAIPPPGISKVAQNSPNPNRLS